MIFFNAIGREKMFSLLLMFFNLNLKFKNVFDKIQLSLFL